MNSMTEDVAGTKWCPFGAGAREFGVNGTNNVPTQIYQQPSTAHCVGSRCMAWRKVTENVLGHDIDHGFGYCGAFGMPDQ